MKTNKLINRREILVGGLTSVGGLLLTGCSRNLPPTYGNILRMGDVLTYSVHRTLLSGKALAREYSHKDISSFTATGTTDPGDPDEPNSSEIYRRLQGGRFADWHLSNRRSSGQTRIPLARRPQAVPLPDADHEAHLRGRLVRNRRMDRRATEQGAGRCGHDSHCSFR